MESYRDVWFQSTDGLNLYARDYPGPKSPRVPLLCLAGLTRNSRDFEPIAPHIAGSRRVIAADYRGRGRSEYAKDAQTYRIDVELEDAIRLLDHLDVQRVAVLGTSRGGMVAMAMAARHLNRLLGVLLNDIGPELDKRGLLRIVRNLRSRPAILNTWQDAIAHFKAGNPGYDMLTDAEWLKLARQVFRDEHGRPVYDYDPLLTGALPRIDEVEAKPLADLWPLFDHLKDKPVSVLRGEHSDLLSVQTVEAMQRRHPDLDAVTVANRGHIPLLDEPESVAAISRWLARIDAAAAHLA
jgi:pimeloyl-ACP methyl ester carboxylesterase